MPSSTRSEGLYNVSDDTSLKTKSPAVKRRLRHQGTFRSSAVHRAVVAGIAKEDWVGTEGSD